MDLLGAAVAEHDDIVARDNKLAARQLHYQRLVEGRHRGEVEGVQALHRQETEIVTMLLDAGANPNVPDNDGYTPLHDVAEMGDCPPARTMLQALLAAGADPSRQEKNGRTPSELAESTGHALPSFQTTLPQSRAADDFAIIRTRMTELRRS